MEHAQRQKSAHMKAFDCYASASRIVELITSVTHDELTHEEALICVDGRNLGQYLLEEGNNFIDEHESPWRTLLGWSDDVRGLRVLTHGSELQDVQLGHRAGAQGLGLLRGEVLLQDEYVRPIYYGWLEEPIGVKKQCYRRRLVNILTERLASMLQTLDGASATFSLLPASDQDQISYEPDGLQDIHLEALFRAISTRHEQGLTCEVDILITHPAGPLQYDACHEYITLVAEQTNTYLRQEESYRIGALLTGREASDLVEHIVRRSDCIVLDCSAPYEEEQPALKNLITAQEMVQSVRVIKPHVPIRASGPFTASNLPLLYLLGIQEVSCAPKEVPFMRLAGAQWELLEQAGKDYSSTYAQG